jgi:hypothetical protein
MRTRGAQTEIGEQRRRHEENPWRSTGGVAGDQPAQARRGDGWRSDVPSLCRARCRFLEASGGAGVCRPNGCHDGRDTGGLRPGLLGGHARYPTRRVAFQQAGGARELAVPWGLSRRDLVLRPASVRFCVDLAGEQQHSERLRGHPLHEGPGCQPGCYHRPGGPAEKQAGPLAT